MAKRSQLDMNKILKQISVEVPKSLEKFANREARKKANAIKKEVLQEFNRHEVTKEIEKGPSGTGSTLLGGRGNFFGFLGFEKGAQPVEILRQTLENSFNLSSRKGRVVKVNQKTFKVEFDIMVPSKLDIYSVTPLSWTTKSWVKGVERGITNYSQTIFKSSDSSRSGVALQARTKINFIKFSPTPYIISILEKAKNKLK